MINPSYRMAGIRAQFFASLNVKIAVLEAKGYEIIRLDVGSPDLPPADPIIQALQKSADSANKHGYQPHKGPLRLREAWATMYMREFGVPLDPQKEILPLLGSKEGIFHLIQAYIQPGDIVFVPDPSYVTYAHGVEFAGGVVFPLPLLARRQFIPDMTSIPEEVLQKAKMLWLNYPNNPTTAIASTAFLAEAAAFAREHDLLLCHDAAYSQVTDNGENAPSILAVPGAREVSVEFNSLSKSHNMAGWRTGVMVGNEEVVQTLYRLKTNLDSGHFLPIIESSIEAMTGDQSWIRRRNEIYSQRRDMAIDYLHSMGLAAAVPQATIYIWSPIPDGWKSEEFALTALEVAGVSTTPGVVFGKHGEGYIRISLTAPVDRIQIAMERLKGWIKG